MYELMEVNIGGFYVPTYILLVALGFLAALAGGVFLGVKRGMKAAPLCMFGVLAAALGLLLGRGVYCAVRWDIVFMDEMGNFDGFANFFDWTIGSANVMGVAAGLLLAAPITAWLTKQKSAELLDAAVIPALAFYAFARAVEPFSGQGFGEFVGVFVSVSAIEAVLTVALLVVMLLLRRKVHKPGSWALYALVLWCVLQILPESLRCDDALYVLVFARVTHLGLAVTLGLTLIGLLIQAGRAGLSRKAIILDLVGLAAGIGLCIATIFALDKTNLPKLLVYAGMVLSLAELAFVICRRIRLTDQR